jgi:hypothetical protein
LDDIDKYVLHGTAGVQFLHQIYCVLDNVAQFLYVWLEIGEIAVNEILQKLNQLRLSTFQTVTDYSAAIAKRFFYF